MQKLVFRNSAGNEIDLTSGSFGIVNWAGLSNADLNIQTQQVPFEDGAVFLDALIEPREIEVTVAVYDGNDLGLRYQKKRELISALNPKLGEGVLIYTNDYLSKQIKAVPQLPIFENKNSNDAGTLKTTVVFSCPSPYWEDLEETEIDLPLGEYVTVENEGDIPAQVEVDVSVISPTASYKISNETSEESITINGVQNENFKINTNIGNKGIYENVASQIALKDGNYIKNVITINGIIYGIRRQSIVKSTDGLDFTEVYNTGFGIEFVELKYFESKHLFVATLTYAKIAISSDGENWQEIDLSEKIALDYSKTIYSVVYSPDLDLFVITSELNRLIRTKDFITFELDADLQSYNLSKSVWFNNKFILGGDNSIIKTSADGVTWATITNPVSNTGIIIESFYINENTLYALCNNSSNVSSIIKTTDGDSWSVVNANIGNNCSFIGKLKNTFIIGGEGFILEQTSSLEGAWTTITLSENDVVFGCTELNNIFYLYSKNTYSSLNLSEWTINPRGVFYGNDLGEIVTNETESIYILVVDDNILKSNDLKKWDVAFSAEDIAHTKIARRLNGKFIVIGGENFYISDNGDNWVTITIGEGIDIRDVAYSSKLQLWFISCKGMLYKSTDLQSFTEIQNVIPSDAGAYIVWAEEQEKLVLIVQSYYIIKISDDGETWTQVGSFLNTVIIRVVYLPLQKRVFLCGQDKSFISDDCIEWDDFYRNRIANIAENKIESLAITSAGNGTFISYNNNYPLDFTTFYKLVVNDYYNGVLWSEKEKAFVVTGKNGQLLLIKSVYENNIINKLTTSSNMNLNLKVGNNTIYVSDTEGIVETKLKFRNKYIGV